MRRVHRVWADRFSISSNRATLLGGREAKSRMRLQRLRTDFNSNSLANRWTLEDLGQQGIELCEGMRCVFYDLDAEDGCNGLLHGVGVVWWDATSGVFRIDLRTLQLSFTPGESVAVLDTEYAEQSEPRPHLSLSDDAVSGR